MMIFVLVIRTFVIKIRILVVWLKLLVALPVEAMVAMVGIGVVPAVFRGHVPTKTS
jgi:hypothetical protein